MSPDLLAPAEVAALRTLMGLSLDHMAAMLGVHPKSPRAWEAVQESIAAFNDAPQD